MTSLDPIVVDDQLFERQVRLPALPRVIQEVLEKTQSGDAEPKEVAELIDQDAAFAAHLLKVVNSAYYGLPVAVGSVRLAIAYLGLGEVARIALTLSVMRTLSGEQAELTQAFWTRSYHTALVSRRLAKPLGFTPDDSEKLYAAALLHDLGKLVYAMVFPDHFAQISQYCRDHGCRAVEAQAALGLPLDTSLGMQLARHWHLPESVRRACAFHELEDLESLGSKEEASPVEVAVCVAALLSVLCVYPLTEDRRQAICQQVQRVLELNNDEFLLLMGDVYQLRNDAVAAVDGLA
ncbi:MAG TPA: HDOD domain-containing protein [Myxococcales bacterium LLY-WYZ-16_1]|jgi:HD-like signal output (HDOD) protein|nr:HDOD domain-containing protein [Myxococcales bacterium LLY-WYZ-16_1]